MLNEINSFNSLYERFFLKYFLTVITHSPTVSCSDKNQHCRAWARAKYCTRGKFIKYMKTSCKKSCNKCWVLNTWALSTTGAKLLLPKQRRTNLARNVKKNLAVREKKKFSNFFKTEHLKTEILQHDYLTLHKLFSYFIRILLENLVTIIRC